MSDFIHYTEQGHADTPVWLLLHGTGADEHDLVPLAKRIAPDWGVVSPRGQVNENGQNRFFRRFIDGTFDQDDLRQRTQDLSGFIAAQRIAFPNRPFVALGFSNGANIAASLLLTVPDILQYAVLLRPMVPFTPDNIPHHKHSDILILSGLLDTICPPEESKALAALLQQTGADVAHIARPATHMLGDKDLQLTSEWLHGKGII